MDFAPVRGSKIYYSRCRWAKYVPGHGKTVMSTIWCSLMPNELQKKKLIINFYSGKKLQNIHLIYCKIMTIGRMVQSLQAYIHLKYTCIYHTQEAHQFLTPIRSINERARTIPWTHENKTPSTLVMHPLKITICVICF